MQYGKNVRRCAILEACHSLSSLPLLGESIQLHAQLSLLQAWTAANICTTCHHLPLRVSALKHTPTRHCNSISRCCAVLT